MKTEHGTLNVLIPGPEIREKTQAMADQISAHLNGEEVVCVCVLKGAFLFFADLVRRMNPPVTVDFVRLASYGDRTKPGEELVFSKDMEESIHGRHVIIVEDIVDTGRSMAYLKNVFSGRSPKSLKICALVDKQERREVDLDVDFPVFNLTGRGFLVGYGMDFAERYRELDGIFELLRESKPKS